MKAALGKKANYDGEGERRYSSSGAYTRKAESLKSWFRKQKTPGFANSNSVPVPLSVESPTSAGLSVLKIR